MTPAEITAKPTLIPAGYLAKSVSFPPGYLDTGTPTHHADIYSLSSCVNDDFADYVNFWKHNGYWLFDRPEIIQTIAQENQIDLTGSLLFYYEVYGLEFDGKLWRAYDPSGSSETNVVAPRQKQLEGFDVVTFFAGSTPECSPLACNKLAEKIPTNSHCLLENFQEAKSQLENGAFADGEPGPYRIFAVYTVCWSQDAA
jgi:hypothetical protein